MRFEWSFGNGPKVERALAAYIAAPRRTSLVRVWVYPDADTPDQEWEDCAAFDAWRVVRQIETAPTGGIETIARAFERAMRRAAKRAIANQLKPPKRAAPLEDR